MLQQELPENTKTKLSQLNTNKLNTKVATMPDNRYSFMNIKVDHSSVYLGVAYLASLVGYVGWKYYKSKK